MDIKGFRDNIKGNIEEAVLSGVSVGEINQVGQELFSQTGMFERSGEWGNAWVAYPEQPYCPNTITVNGLQEGAEERLARVVVSLVKLGVTITCQERDNNFVIEIRS